MKLHMNCFVSVIKNKRLVDAIAFRAIKACSFLLLSKLFVFSFYSLNTKQAKASSHNMSSWFTLNAQNSVFQDNALCETCPAYMSSSHCKAPYYNETSELCIRGEWDNEMNSVDYWFEQGFEGNVDIEVSFRLWMICTVDRSERCSFELLNEADNVMLTPYTGERIQTCVLYLSS